MAGAHDALYAFHQDRVTLSDRELERLRRLRDLNLQRLREGLAAIGVAPYVSARGQGGYAMATLTQRDDGEQDIDVALVFDAAHLPARPAEARAWVLDAVLAAAPEGFRRPPERRTNAVTVWYAGGYHIDFAVYRTDGRSVEHAGADWQPADPGATVDWFVAENRRRSPKWAPGALVQDGQLRRIVRIMKFLRHGDQEDYPGGYIITALACRCYQPSAAGDDVALAATLARAAQEIRGGRDLPDPVLRGHPLLPRQRDAARLLRYGALLVDTLRPLQPHFASAGKRRDAVAAWELALGVELLPVGR